MSIGQKIREALNPALRAKRAADATEAARTHAFNQAVQNSTLPAVIRTALVERGHRNQTPQAAIEYAATLRDLCFASSADGMRFKPELRASLYVQNNADIERVRTDLLNAMADASEAVELVTTIPEQSKGQAPLSSSAVYANRNGSSK